MVVASPSYVLPGSEVHDGTHRPRLDRIGLEYLREQPRTGCEAANRLVQDGDGCLTVAYGGPQGPSPFDVQPSPRPAVG